MSQYSRFAQKFGKGSFESRRPSKPSNNTYYQYDHIQSKQAKPHSKPTGKHELIYGVQSVIGALTAQKRRIYTLYVKQDHSKEKDRSEKIDKIISLYKSATGSFPALVENDQLNRMVSTQPHQGVILETSFLEPEVLNYLTATHATQSKYRKNPLWVLLDEIMDPHNLGAIIRSCVYFGVDGIVTSEVRSAPLNSTVSKTSAGALEVADIFYPGNVSRFLEGSKEAGWRVIGTSLDDHSKPANSDTLNMDKPTILVLGNEATGMRNKVANLCDYSVRLDAIATGPVSSLNVSVASALLIHPLATHPCNKL